jgi:FtsH-binding integral membrane protein
MNPHVINSLYCVAGILVCAGIIIWDYWTHR